MPRIDVPFVVEKQRITQPTREVLISGGKNYFYATFIINELWEDVRNLKAVFVTEEVAKLVSLTKTEEGFECKIPWEVMTDKGTFQVGIFGGDRLLTDYAYVVVRQGCVTDGEVPAPPSEDWFTKIEGEIEELRESGGGGGIAKETDPTVPEWAKQPEKPTYTAEEVGALPKDTALVKEEDVVHYVNEQTKIIKTDVEGLQKQLNEEAHFRGYLSTNAKIQEMDATPNDFAYSAESGTVWVYDAEKGWQETDTIVPDQMIPASNAMPLINGVASVGQSEEYARGDHRHPTDTTRASVNSVLNEVSTHNSNAQSHIDIREKLDTVEAIAEGASVSETFESYSEMISVTNVADKDKYKKGRNINIITVGVPDLWVAYVSDNAIEYTYTSDKDFLEELKANGTVQVGYYKLATLETQKVDLADYAKKEDVTSALGGCVFKQVTQEEYDAMYTEGTLSTDVIYVVGGGSDAS